jgi:hypothetical protein
MRRLLLVAALVGVFVLPASAAATILKVTDHNTTCAVVNNGTAVNCSGKLTGLGSSTTQIEVLANFTCTNKAGNTVVGQSAGQSAPITPDNGQVTFSVTTASTRDRCTRSDDHRASFGPSATINVYQNGVLVFTEQVPIQQ